MSDESKTFQFLKDLVSTLIIVAVIVGCGIALTGTWPFMVAIESGSMEPNMHVGDVVILLSPSRVNIVTWEEGVKTGYQSFGNYGDVIVYRPNGYGKPIIHRAIAYVHKGDYIPAIVNGRLILTNQIAENDGYITQGDNVRTNQLPDQAVPAAFSPIGEKIKPVREEWIIGVAKFRIPYVGYIRLLIPL